MKCYLAVAFTDTVPYLAFFKKLQWVNYACVLYVLYI